MNKHLKYLWYVLRHKWFVLLAGLDFGLPLLQLIIHDWDKFLPSMAIAYANTFRNEDGTRREKPVPHPDFQKMVMKHYHRQPHHWNHWVGIDSNGERVCLPIPMKYLLEMIADWHGTGRAHGKPDTLAWYKKNRAIIQLHPRSREIVDTLVGWKEIG